MANSDLIQSVVNALDLLRFVASRPDGVRLGEIAERFDMKPPTAHNLVRTLRARDFLKQDASRRLRLGSAPAELVAVEQQCRITSAAEAALARLNRKWPEAKITLSESSGTEIFCRVRMSPDRPGEIQHPLAFTFSCYLTVTGLVFLAFGRTDMAELEQKYPFDEFGLPHWKSRAALREAVDGCRRDGYAERTSTSGGYSLACPVGDRFAIGASLPEPPGKERDALLAALRKTAVQLTDDAKSKE